MNFFEKLFYINDDIDHIHQRLKSNLYEQDYGVIRSIDFGQHLFVHVKPFVYRSIFFSTLSSILIVSTALVGKMIIEKTNETSGGSGYQFVGVLGFLISFILLFTYLSIKNRNNLRLAVELFVIKTIFKNVLVDAKLTDERKNKIKTSVSSDARQLAMVFSEASRTIVPSVIFTLISAPVIIYLSGISGAITICFIFTLIPVALYCKKRIAIYQQEVKSKEDSYNNSLEHWFRNFLQIKYEKIEFQIVDSLVALYEQFVIISNKSHTLFLMVFGLTNLWWLFSLTCLVVMVKVFNQKIEASEFFSILWILSLMIRYFTGIPTFITSISNAKVVLARVRGFIQKEPLLLGDTSDLGRKVLSINLKNINHAVDGKVIFENLNIHIPLSGVVYIKGDPGVGKSLLLNMLAGNVVPDSGQIIFCLSDGSELEGEDFFKNAVNKISFLQDSPFLFRGSVKQNILVDFDNSLRDKDVSDILRFVELEHELMEDYSITEGGKNLSGGQKQRVVLGRAIAMNSDFFIFDNPFSALDDTTIEKICYQLKIINKPLILTSTRKDPLGYNYIIDLGELKK